MSNSKSFENVTFLFFLGWGECFHLQLVLKVLPPGTCTGFRCANLSSPEWSIDCSVWFGGSQSWVYLRILQEVGSDMGCGPHSESYSVHQRCGPQNLFRQVPQCYRCFWSLDHTLINHHLNDSIFLERLHLLNCICLSHWKWICENVHHQT